MKKATITLLVLLDVFLASRFAYGGDPALPKMEPIDLGGGVFLNFCFCPAGELLPDKPILKKAPVVFQAFFISQCELSQREFEAVMGADYYARIKKRAEDMAFGKGFEDKNNPMFAVSLTEALEFCKRLEELCEANSLSFEKRTFRIPTHWEWQYACRASQKAGVSPHFHDGYVISPDGKHFPVQPVKLADLHEDVRVSIQERLKGLDESEKGLEFRRKEDQFQHQVMSILEKFKINEIKGGDPPIFREDSLKTLNAYLEAGLKFQRPIAKNPGLAPHPSRLSLANAWGLYEMHGNVCEWTLSSGEATKKQDFVHLNKYKEYPKDVKRLSFVLAGGGFSLAAEHPDVAEMFTVWGGKRLNFSEATQEKDLNVGEESYRDYLPGLRIVMESEVSLDRMRERIVRAQKIDPRSIDALNELVKRLPYLEPRPAEAKQLLADIEGYKWHAQSRLGDVEGARMSLGRFTRLQPQNQQAAIYNYLEN